MRLFFWILLSTLLLSSPAVHAVSKAELKKAKEQMIQQSIRQYFGNCPCPYNVMRNGRSCGKRSAYSKPGGAAPLCFVEDISDQQAISFLEKSI